jgi:hypothetical protein
MMKHVTSAGVLGGIVLFVWGAVSHMMLPLGMAGLRSMSATQESAVVSAMQSAMHERAIYFFPGMDMSKAPSPEEEKAWKARYASGPAGIVVFNPRPGSPMSAGMLMTDLASNIVAALLAALLIGFVPGVLGYGKRVLLVGLIGLLVAIDVDVSYWNWYGFPTSYLLAQLVDHFVGWLLAGLVIARFSRG